MTLNRTNNPSSLRRKRGGALSGSSTHRSLYTEPGFEGLHAPFKDITEGLPEEYNSSTRPTRSKPIRKGKGTKADPYWPVPMEYGPNYHHNLADAHFAAGGHLMEALHAAAGHWIQNTLHHPGALHEMLGIPKGKKIPERKLEKATHSRNPLLKKRAVWAKTVEGFHHKG